MNIIAVIVLYNDATEEALSHVGKIAKQVNTLCLVDNSSTDNGELFRIIDNAVYIPLLANKGIAAAQNVGIDYAISHQADFIYFADPDSQVPDDAVDKLLASYQGLSEKNISVGGIGSMARDKTTQKAYPLRSNMIGEHKEWGVTEVGYIMNSSSLIPIKLFQTAGKMDERLFIDGVDCEFCWRASYLHGYRFFITPNVVIDHQLGIPPIQEFPLAQALSPYAPGVGQGKQMALSCQNGVLPSFQVTPAPIYQEYLQRNKRRH